MVIQHLDTLMSMYQLLSGTPEDQKRYESLIYKLSDEAYLRTRKVPQNQYDSRCKSQFLCNDAIIGLLIEEGPQLAHHIIMNLAHIYSKARLRKGIRQLRTKGVLSYVGKRYCVIHRKSNDPTKFAIGAPVVFMAGTRSEQVGEIVDMRRLRTHPDKVFPIISLPNGNQVFASTDTATVNTEYETAHTAAVWVLEQLNYATPIGYNALARMAYDAGMSIELAKVMRKLEKDGRVVKKYNAKYSVSYLRRGV